MQGYISSVLTDVQMVTIVSAILLYLASILTATKQVLSVEIKTKSGLYSSIITVLAVTVGGVIDLLNVFSLDDLWRQRIRLIVGGLILLLNLASKTLFPAQPESEIIENVKETLSR
jgi:undecaprenyl pyrophosphate phosphatase UppP